MKGRLWIMILLCCSFSSKLQAQILSYDIDIIGLTCSQCSRSVEMKLRKIPQVKEVVMDLEQTKAHVILNKSYCSPLQIANAVKDAGFNVGTLFMNMDSEFNTTESCFKIKSDAFQIIYNDHALSKRFQLLGIPFQPKKTVKNNILNLPASECKGTNKFMIQTI